MGDDGNTTAPCLRAGWGVKLSFGKKKFANWKVRRFELTQREFRYTNQKEKTKGCLARGEIVFAESVSLHSVPKWNSSSVTKHYPFAIRVWIGQEPFYFCVATEEQQQQWVLALNSQEIATPGTKKFKSVMKSSVSQII